jgi:hypothetical protein
MYRIANDFISTHHINFPPFKHLVCFLMGIGYRQNEISSFMKSNWDKSPGVEAATKRREFESKLKSILQNPVYSYACPKQQDPNEIESFSTDGCPFKMTDNSDIIKLIVTMNGIQN